MIYFSVYTKRNFKVMQLLKFSHENFCLQLVGFWSHHEDRANTLPGFNQTLIAAASKGGKGSDLIS